MTLEATSPLFDYRHAQFTPHTDWVLKQIRPTRAPIYTLISWDKETTLIQPAQTVPTAVCMSSMLIRPSWDPAAGGAQGVFSPRLHHARFDRAEMYSHIRAALLDRHALHLGANIAYDLCVIANEFPDLLELIFDAYEDDRILCIQMAEQLIHLATNRLEGEHGPDGQWIKHHYDLASIARRHLGIELDKDTWRLKYGTLLNVPLELWPQGAIEYPILDAICPAAIFLSQCHGTGSVRGYLTTPERVGAELTLLDVFRQTRTQFWVNLMQARGFALSAANVARLKDLVTRELDFVMRRLQQAGMVRANGQRDTKAAAAHMVAVCAARGLSVKMTTGGEKGEPQVALDYDACVDTGDPLLNDYASYTSLTNILSKDIAALEEPARLGMPIQARFEIIKATGRMSSSGGKKKPGAQRTTYSYQLHNVRKELGIERIKKLDEKIDEKIGVRQCFVPRPGYLLASIDYSMFELHAWAQASVYLGVPLVNLINTLNAGIDVHLKLGARLLGTTFEDVLARKGAPEVKDARQAAKGPNFGLPGGLGEKGLIGYLKSNYNKVIDLPTAKLYKRSWKEEWEPEAYFAVISKIVGAADMGEIIHPISYRRRAWASYTETANGFFQSLAADTKKAAGWRITREMYLPGTALYGSRLVDEIHDEFLVEVPIDIAHEASWRAAEVMIDEGKKWMPDCPPRCEPALMWEWSKAAETKKDASGRLIPWEPKTREIDYVKLFGG